MLWLHAIEPHARRDSKPVRLAAQLGDLRLRATDEQKHRVRNRCQRLRNGVDEQIQRLQGDERARVQDQLLVRCDAVARAHAGDFVR